LPVYNKIKDQKMVDTASLLPKDYPEAEIIPLKEATERAGLRNWF
jgi:hypothetical protein